MKHLRRIASLLLAVVLVLALSVGAFATQEGTLTGGSITIDNAIPGQTYKAYQLLYLESYDASADAYAYKANSAWETWLKTQTTYLSFDSQGYVTWVEGADAAEFAKLAQEKAATLTADATATAPAAETGKTTSTVSFTSLKLGYYLIDTSLGTLCSLDTTNPTVTMEEKNEVPTVEKKVKEDDAATGSEWVDENDADINQTVEFKTTIKAKTGAQSYVLHDKMDAGLTFDSTSVIVYKGSIADANKLTAGSDKDYELKTTGLESADPCTFHIVFSQTFLDGLTADTDIIVTYSATLNKDAVVAGAGNPNKTKLDYSETSGVGTAWDETKTYTWPLEVYKYAEKKVTETDSETGETTETTVETALSGAEFMLYTEFACTTKVGLVQQTDADGQAVANTYRRAVDGETTTLDKIKTDSTGRFTVNGLDSGTYYLKEITAPAGYNMLEHPIKVEVTSTGKLDYYTYGGKDKDTGEDIWTKVNDNTPVDEVKVLNNSGAELPSTGGMGTTMFYVLGSVLALGAVVLLVTRKRMSKNH